MEEISTTWAVANVAWWITFWAILTYFWLTAEWLMVLSALLVIDIIFWLLDSYIVSKDTSSVKLVEWLARKFTRWALPFILVAALRWVGYEWIEAISNIVMSVLIISEWYSIVWHIYSINYGKKLKEIDALKILLEKIAELFKWELTKKDNSSDNPLPDVKKKAKSK